MGSCSCSWSKAITALTFESPPFSSSSTSPSLHLFLSTSPSAIPPAAACSSGIKLTQSYLYPSISKKKASIYICRAAEYKFPDPIPEFADAETEKFKTHLHTKLLKKEVCGDSIEEVVGICTQILSTFLHSEYGGPGTLLVIPFIDMADTINERGLPGGPQAARVAVKWAQDNVDKDWKQWTGGDTTT
ncbi:protein PLASTID REDOX INSENSITIVE 2, chloroplastic [Euphorbia lathyris]|uniref:protein PLASTID REDOX INSENSITIVE 2, chloroplastic n=1 Tax=Euphorbia lathyris TaxID=212925 RepID=UPI0033144E93